MMFKQDLDTLKRKIRKLKRFEIKIRFNNNANIAISLIWDDFFDLHEQPRYKTKYTLNMI